jgi:hypothetical protein
VHAHTQKKTKANERKANKGYVTHSVALPFTLKSILRQKKKKKNHGNTNISPYKNISIFKKSSKRIQNPSRYHNSRTNLKFQHKPKLSCFQNPHIKIDLLLLLPSMGKNPLSYYTLE